MLPLQVTLFTMSKRLSPAVEDCHQLEKEPVLTHFQMLQIPNTQKALIQHSCLSYAQQLFPPQTAVLQCQPDSTLTVDKRNTKPFFTGWIYVLS